MSDKKRLNRRSFLTRVAGGAAVIGGAMSLVSGTAQAQITDRDPTDGGGNGRGTGRTDRDPTDGACNGRGATPTGHTDTDPRDPRGNGRGTGRSDSDPTDRPCAGRGTRR